MPEDPDQKFIRLSDDLNVPAERADFLVKEYIRIPFQQWYTGAVVGLRIGHIIMNIVDRDELTTNEKCFLSAILADLATSASIRSELLTDIPALERRLDIKVNFTQKDDSNATKQNH